MVSTEAETCNGRNSSAGDDRGAHTQNASSTIDARVDRKALDSFQVEVDFDGIFFLTRTMLLSVFFDRCN